MQNPTAADASFARTTLTFKSVTDSPANVTQAAQIARMLKIKIGRGIGAGKYSCEVALEICERINEETVLRCTYGSVSY